MTTPMDRPAVPSPGVPDEGPAPVHDRAGAKTGADGPAVARLGPRGLAVFCDQTGLWWLRWLRRGFRHCFLVLDEGDGCLLVDPLAQQTELTRVRGVGLDHVAGWCRRRGFRVVPCRVCRAPRRALGWRPFSCVEVVKRILGLQLPWVLTPFQLYRIMNNIKNDEKILDMRN